VGCGPQLSTRAGLRSAFLQIFFENGEGALAGSFGRGLASETHCADAVLHMQEPRFLPGPRSSTTCEHNTVFKCWMDGNHKKRIAACLLLQPGGDVSFLGVLSASFSAISGGRNAEPASAIYRHPSNLISLWDLKQPGLVAALAPCTLTCIPSCLTLPCSCQYEPLRGPCCTGSGAMYLPLCDPEIWEAGHLREADVDMRRVIHC